MKKRYLLLAAAAALCAALCFWLLCADVCIGRIENRTDSQWSQIHLYMNGGITVPFPITVENQPCVFQYETGRGAFTVTITDAEGNILHSETTDSTGSIAFPASSDLTLTIRGKGHGGVFSIASLDHLGPEEDPYNANRVLGEGSHNDGAFTVTYSCRKVEGKRLNFYVENQGSEAVVLTINDSYSRMLSPGEAGHISAPISASAVEQTMTLKCVSIGGDDKDVVIYWKAAQRN